MSLYFTSRERDIWNPASETGRLYCEQVASIAKELGVESGLGPVISDEVEIDEGVFVAFVQAALALCLTLGAGALSGLLILPSLAISVALAEQLGSADLPAIPAFLVDAVAAARAHVGVRSCAL